MKWLDDPVEQFLMLDFVLMDTIFVAEMIKQSKSGFWMAYGAAKENEDFANRDEEDRPEGLDSETGSDFLTEELFEKYVGEESNGLTYPLYLEMRKSEIGVREVKEEYFKMNGA